MAGNEQIKPRQASCKYDRLKDWKTVQSDITHYLATHNEENESITIPREGQLVQTLRHRQPIRCMLHIYGKSNDIFVTHFGIGSSKQVNFWTVERCTKKVHFARFGVHATLRQLVYAKKQRIFVGYSEDMSLRVFSDASQGFNQLSITRSHHAILTMAYNQDRDEVVAGGVGCVLRYSVTDFHNGLKLIGIANTDMTRDEWVLNLKVDPKHQTILAQCDSGFYIIDYRTDNQLSYQRCGHKSSLTCIAVYKKRDYLITGAQDGSIKVWSSVSFNHITDLAGHLQSVTAMLIHNTEPILMSASIDGTIRLWRLNTFEVFQRFDVGEKILGLNLLNSQEIVYWTDKEVKIWKLNMFHRVMTTIQSGVKRILRSSSNLCANRIVTSAADGGIRLVSPVSGDIITIMYPLPTHQILTEIAYCRDENSLFVLLLAGQVLKVDCSTNPCQAKCVLMRESPDQEVTCLEIFNVIDHDENNDISFCEQVLFCGRKDGLISLLNAPNYTMKNCVKAHQSEVSMLRSSQPLYPKHNSSLAGTQLLLSIGHDRFTKIWRVEHDRQLCKLDMTCMKHVLCCDVPKHVAMLGNVVCLGYIGKGLVHMYKVEKDRDQKMDTGWNILIHDPDEDHLLELIRITACAALGIFATLGLGGTVKIWNMENQLVREMTFSGSVNDICFANERGDLLVGFDTQIHFVPVINYLPYHYLEWIVTCDFRDDSKEELLPFNHQLQLCFSWDKVRHLPASLNERRIIMEHESLLSSARSIDKIDEGNIKHSDKNTMSNANSKESISNDETGKCGQMVKLPKENILVSKSQGKSTKPRLRVITDCRESKNVNDVNAETVTEIRSQEIIHECSEESEDNKEDPEAETDEADKKLPIARDGYIPNSVVRDILGFKPDTSIATAQAKWTLRPVPPIPSADNVSYISSENSLDMKWEDDDYSNRVFIWEDDEDEVDDIEQEEDKESDKDAVESVDQEHIGKLEEKREGRKEIARKKNNLKSIRKKDIETKQTDTDMIQQHIPNVSFAMTNKHRSKLSKQLPVMKEEHNLAKSRSLLEEIVSEAWVPDTTLPEVPAITKVFSSLMSQVNAETFEKICSYIEAIDTKIGFLKAQYDIIMAKLFGQVHHPNSAIRFYAVKAITEIGQERKDIVKLLPLLTDAVEQIRDIVSETLKEKLDMKSKDDLFELLASSGVRLMNPDQGLEKQVLETLTQSSKDTLENGQLFSHSSTEEWLKNCSEGHGEQPNEPLWTDEEFAINYIKKKEKRDRYKMKILIKAITSKTGTGEQSDPRNKIDKRVQQMASGSSRVHRKVRVRRKMFKQRQRVSHSEENLASLPEIAGFSRSVSKKSRFLPDSSFMYAHYRRLFADMHKSRRVSLGGVNVSSSGHNRTQEVRAFPRYDQIPVSNKSIKEQHVISTQGNSRYPRNNIQNHNGSQKSLLQRHNAESVVHINEDSDFLSGSDGNRSHILENTVLRKYNNKHKYVTISNFDNNSCKDSGLGTCESRERTLTLPPLSDHKKPHSKPTQQAQSTDLLKRFLNRPEGRTKEESFSLGRILKNEKIKPFSLPPIQYAPTSSFVTQGDAGVRLVHAVTIAAAERKQSKCFIIGLPGKLGSHTSKLQGARSNYGLLGLHWTTGIPVLPRVNVHENHTIKGSTFAKNQSNTAWVLEQYPDEQSDIDMASSSTNISNYTLTSCHSSDFAPSLFKWQEWSNVSETAQELLES